MRDLKNIISITILEIIEIIKINILYHLNKKKVLQDISSGERPSAMLRE
jgi:hypothetical protein